MYNDPTCDICHEMLESEYGVEEPHFAHCSITHERGEHNALQDDGKADHMDIEDPNTEYYDSMHGAGECTDCGKYDTLILIDWDTSVCPECNGNMGEERKEIEILRQEQLIQDSLDMLNVVTDIMEGR